MKQNVTLAVAGQKSLNDPDTISIIKNAILTVPRNQTFDAIRMENLIKKITITDSCFPTPWMKTFAQRLL